MKNYAKWSGGWRLSNLPCISINCKLRGHEISSWNLNFGNYWTIIPEHVHQNVNQNEPGRSQHVPTFQRQWDPIRQSLFSKTNNYAKTQWGLDAILRQSKHSWPETSSIRIGVKFQKGLRRGFKKHDSRIGVVLLSKKNFLGLWCWLVASNTYKYIYIMVKEGECPAICGGKHTLWAPAPPFTVSAGWSDNYQRMLGSLQPNQPHTTDCRNTTETRFKATQNQTPKNSPCFTHLRQHGWRNLLTQWAS